eukprot:3795835-Rhodomonas_salina.1
MPICYLSTAHGAHPTLSQYCTPCTPVRYLSTAHGAHPTLSQSRTPCTPIRYLSAAPHAHLNAIAVPPHCTVLVPPRTNLVSRV